MGPTRHRPGYTRHLANFQELGRKFDEHWFVVYNNRRHSSVIKYGKTCRKGKVNKEVTNAEKYGRLSSSVILKVKEAPLYVYRTRKLTNIVIPDLILPIRVSQHPAEYCSGITVTLVGQRTRKRLKTGKDSRNISWKIVQLGALEPGVRPFFLILNI